MNFYLYEYQKKNYAKLRKQKQWCIESWNVTIFPNVRQRKSIQNEQEKSDLVHMMRKINGKFARIEWMLKGP